MHVLAAEHVGRPRPSFRGRRRAVVSSVLLLFGAGLDLLPLSARAWALSGKQTGFPSFPVADRVLSDGAGLRDVALPAEELSESPLRESDIAGARRERDGGDRELAYFKRAIALEKANEWKSLLDLSRKWSEAYPSEAAAWFFLGLADEKLGKYHEAIRAYREAIRRKQDFAKAWCNLGTCCMRIWGGTRKRRMP
ncbi:protein of unknown function [Methylacidimicrobium sp. AP8]|uniref:tetratricopeptide repeat protein n=1 Tax=Methylacidimicrobium sp. AP8 TaxID=2730359 RepID=UPI0018C1076A|nr:tetratricopeptide repeat protein [Methylacidimicrobium sp. AP8]CAB4243694.1 protein of unknown function [Methylacidimicrobium sp. AP8]